MKLVLNKFTLSFSIALALGWFSNLAWAQGEEAPAPPEPPMVEEAPAESSKADTTEITWRDRRFIIIADEEGKRIEVKDVEDKTKDIDNDEDFDEDWDEEWDWDEDDDDDYAYRQKEETHRRKKSEVDLLGLDLGISNYYFDGRYGANAVTPELTVREFRPGAHVALHLLPTRVSLLGRGYVNLKTAITIDWSNYYFTNDITLVDGGEALAFDTTGISFDRNKLVSRYAQIPLLLNFNTDPGGDDGLSVSVGGYAGIFWGARTKQISDEEGTVKVDGEYFLNPYRYGLMARIDFKWFDFYAMYNLSEHFTEGQGPQTQTFMAGINIIDF